MNSSQAIQLAVLVVFVLSALAMTGLVVLKAVNRSRRSKAARRKRTYMNLIARHVTYKHCTDPIEPGVEDDPMFIEALIDVRNALVGADLAEIQELAGRHGVIERQVAHLRASFPRVRRLRAAVALAELGDESTAPVLMEALTDREPEVRVQAARGLGRMKWTPAIDAIVARFDVETPWVRARFADTLVGFGSDATWPLLAYIRVNHMHDTPGPVSAIRTLAMVGDDQAVQSLVEVLNESHHAEIRIATIDALGLLANPYAAPALRNAVHSADWRIRAKAVSALGSVHDRDSFDLLSRSLGDQAWWVRRNAASALASIPGGLDRLYDALVGDNSLAAEAAGEALADLGELTASRQRREDGEADARDLALLDQMGGFR